MDLNQVEKVEDADSFDFEVINPKDRQTLMFLTLAGPTNPARLAVARKYDRKLSNTIKRSQDLKRALTSTFTDALDDEDVQVDRQVELLMASTLGWSGLTTGGNPAPFDKDVMEKWYRAKRWLRDMVTAELNRSENFIGSSQKV
jgi:hypothetical protein